MKTFTYERESKTLTRLNCSRFVSMGTFALAAASMLILSHSTDRQTAVSFHRVFYFQVFKPRVESLKYAKFTDEEVKAWVAFKREQMRQAAKPGVEEFIAMNI